MHQELQAAYTCSFRPHTLVALLSSASLPPLLVSHMTLASLLSHVTSRSGFLPPFSLSLSHSHTLSRGLSLSSFSLFPPSLPLSHLSPLLSSRVFHFLASSLAPARTAALAP